VSASIEELCAEIEAASPAFDEQCQRVEAAMRNGGVSDELRAELVELARPLRKAINRLEQTTQDKALWDRYGPLSRRVDGALTTKAEAINDMRPKASLPPLAKRGVSAPVDESSDALLDRFNAWYGSPAGREVVAVTRRGERLETTLASGIEVMLGTNEHVLDPRKMDARMAPAMGFEPAYFTPKEWRSLGYCLINAASEDETSRRAEEVETKEWIAGFLENPTALPGGGGLDWTLDTDVPLTSGDAKLYHALVSDAPAFRGADRRLYLRVGKLLKFVNAAYGQRVARDELTRRLSRLGFTKPGNNDEGMIASRPPDDTPGKVVGPPKSRRYLASPPGFDPDRAER